MLLFSGWTILRDFGDGLEDDFNAGAAKEVDAVGETILTGIDDALDATLDNAFGTLYAWAIGDL